MIITGQSYREILCSLVRRTLTEAIELDDPAPVVATELGAERLCAGPCREYWPADDEFFRATGGRLASVCRACSSTAATAERRQRRERAQERVTA